MKQEADGSGKARPPIGGLAGWLLGKLRVARRPAPRLAVLERITLAPRQSLALVEADGRRFLVATSAEGTPAFYALDTPRRPAAEGTAGTGRTEGRIAVRPAKRPGVDRDLRVSW
ncbi:MAG: flagellar biosynthetic protein FliO [Terracidiphilus sp.]